jgi:hypothetical protein
MSGRAAPLLLAALLALAAAPPARGEGGAWPESAVRLVAADAAAFAPPDLKRQLARHRAEFMQGVSEGRAEGAQAGPARAREAAVRRARAIGAGIPKHVPFWDAAREAGALAALAAAAFPPPDPAGAAGATRGTSFLGYGPKPFDPPEGLAAAPLPSGTDREAYDAAVTLATRLLAWAWKTAGGDASIATLYPESKGPYRVRD